MSELRKTKYLQTKDSRIAYEVIGKGPAMFFIHGWPLNRSTYYGLAQILKEKYTCYLIDSAGLGDSSWSPQTDFSFPGHARRVSELAQELGLKEYEITAHNTGASIARIAAYNDTKVKALYLFNTEIPNHRPPFVQMYQFLFRLPFVDRITGNLLKSLLYLKSPMAFGGSFYDKERIGGEFYENAIQPLVKSRQRMLGAIEYIKGLDWQLVDSFAKDIHPKLEVPVQLIWGEDDPTFPLGEAQLMNKQFKNSPPITVIPKAKLLVHEEKPAEVAAAILKSPKGLVAASGA